MKKKTISLKITLIIAPLVLFSSILINGKAFYWGTPSTQFIPWWSFAWRSLLEGQLPLWNPWVGMGAPLAANYQSGLFYPPYWIYFLVYAVGGASWMAWSVTLIVCAHLIWAGWGTAKLLERLQVRELGQTIGGLAFSLSGYLVARAGFLSINAAVSWLPWLLLGIMKAAGEGKKGILPITGPIAMLLLAGHAQTAWYCLLLGGLWMLVWSMPTKAGVSRILKQLGRGLVQYGTAGLLAVGISAIQLLPTLEYLLNSQRAGEYGYNQAVTYSFWPWRFLTLFVPNLFGSPVHGNYWGYGNFWEDAVYIGLLPIGLALGVLCKRIFAKNKLESDHQKKIDNRVVILLGSATAVGFLLALGKNTPVFPFLYRFIPTFDLFQAPSRWTIWAVFSLALLAGIGVDSLSKPAGKGLYFTRLAAAGCLAVIAGSILTWYFIVGVKPTFLVPTGIAGLLGFLSILLVLLLPPREVGDKYRIWSWGVVVFVCMDLIVAGWGLNPGIKLDYYQEIKRETSQRNGRSWIPAADEYQLKYKRYFLFDSFAPLEEWGTMWDIPLPNLGMLTKVEMVNNFDPLVPELYQNWLDEINSRKVDPELLRLMDVGRTIRVSNAGISTTDWDLPADSRLRVVGCQAVIEAKGSVLQKVMESPGDYYQDILVTSSDDIDCNSGVTGTVGLISRTNGHLMADVSMDDPGWLFWSQSWFPGWKVRVDGAELSSSYPANYAFQAAAVPAGKHQVEFIYQPLSVIWGGAVTLVSLALWAVLAVVTKRNNSKRG